MYVFIYCSLMAEKLDLVFQNEFNIKITFFEHLEA